MDSTLRNFRPRFHEKRTLIFAILRYFRLKEQLKLLTLLQNTLESLVIHLCLAKTFHFLVFFCFCFFNWTAKWIKHFTFKFISGFTPNRRAASVLLETTVPQRFQLERLLTERSLHFDLRGTDTAQPFIPKVHCTILGRESCLDTINIFMSKCFSQVHGDGLG